MEFMDYRGWNIDVDELPGPDRKKWAYLHDESHIHDKSDVLCLIYSIAEIRMGWYAGRIVIFVNKDKPVLWLNPVNYVASGYSNHVSFSANGRYIFIKISVFYEKLNRVYLPFLVVDTVDKRWSIIYISNGFHYDIEEIDDNNFKLKENYRDERFISMDDEFIELSELTWFKLEELNELKELIDINKFQ